MERIPRIKVEFILGSERADINDIASNMNIQSSLSRTQFPANSIATPFWYFQTKELYSLSLKEPIHTLINQIKDKKDVIRSLCAKYDIVPIMQIVVYFNYKSRPEMCIPSDVIAFLASLNAEIDIEPCID
jgi:hypothetical protein